MSLLITFSVSNNFGIFNTPNLYEPFINSGHSAINGPQNPTSTIAERLQETAPYAKPITLSFIACVATYYTVKCGLSSYHSFLKRKESKLEMAIKQSWALNPRIIWPTHLHPSTIEKKEKQDLKIKTLKKLEKKLDLEKNKNL